MNNQLTAPEYYYLSSPFLSGGGKMVKYTLIDQCIKEKLFTEEKWIYLNPRDRRARKRLFFELNPKYSKKDFHSKQSLFFYEILFNQGQIRFYQVRNMINKKLDSKIDNFKKNYIKVDLKKKGLINYFGFKTKKAKALEKKVSISISNLEEQIDYLITNDKDKLIKIIEELGSNVIFLQQQTLKKISDHLVKLKQLGALEVIAKQSSSFHIIDVLSMDSFNSFDSNSFGGFDSFFDGFGGGDFGGAGAGFDW